MIETLEYIELYFSGKLSASEKGGFERRCESDPVFAEDVAFYISTRSELKASLRDEKRREFKELSAGMSAQNPSKGILRKLYPLFAAAAACLVLFMAWQFLFKDNLSKVPPARLANLFIEKNIEKPGVTMGEDKDSLDSGISAYNKKNYKVAEKIFLALSSQENKNAEALKYLGFLYLVNGEFDKAISQFDTLARQKDLYANPGLFYKAVTLMKRSADGDITKAKLILKEVIEKNLPGSKEAREWINKM